MSTALPRIAILDDYQKVAFTFADWTALKERVSIDVFTDTISDEDALVARLESYSVICAMRERTKFRASLLDRLPNLKFIATTGRKNAGIDIAYAKVSLQLHTRNLRLTDLLHSLDEGYRSVGDRWRWQLNHRAHLGVDPVYRKAYCHRTCWRTSEQAAVAVYHSRRPPREDLGPHRYWWTGTENSTGELVKSYLALSNVSDQWHCRSRKSSA